MNKKLEARITRLEKALSRKNEQMDDPTANAIYDTANQIRALCKSLAVMLKSTNDASWPEVENALALCEDSFPEEWFERFERFVDNNKYSK